MDDVTLAGAAEDWTEAGLSCAPARRRSAETAVRKAYTLAGLKAPTRIVWLDSPEAGALAVALLAEPRTARFAGPGAAALAELRAQFCVDVPLGRSVRPLVRTRPWAQARAALVRDLGPVGFARHWAAAARRPWQQVMEQLVTPLRTRLDAQFAVNTHPVHVGARAALLDVVHGQHDAAWLGAFPTTPALAGLAGVARSAGWWWAYENVAVLTERPTAVHRDNVGRLHRGDGPALSYPDGYGLHAWRGMPIPPEVADELPRLTVARIRAEDNAEVRRVMLEHFGFDRYLAESGATKAHSDGYGTLWRVDLARDEPLVMVEVLNSTPEPDGTRRTYFLRVPPGTRTARAGVAWTFGLTEEEYAPLAQT
ncbi:DUF6745 domain-containing protein [Longispora urticae]